ncbi:MAG: NADH-quinone oxidoreductase subunit C, partial [Candidatus Acidiferrales bacterium]
MESGQQNESLAVRKLKERDPNAITEIISFRGETTVVLPRNRLISVCEFLKADRDLDFAFLSDISAVDRFPVDPR